MRRVHADLLILACAAIWGIGFLFQKSAMDHVGPALFVAARAAVAALVLAPLALLEHRRATSPMPRRLPAAGALAGAVFLLAALLQQAGLQWATVTNTAFLTALYVVATPFLARALTGRAMAPAVWAPAALAFLGMGLLGGGTIGGFGVGEALVIASALLWAWHVVLLGLAAPLGRPLLFTALQFFIVGVAAFAVALVFEPVRLADLAAASVEILYVGVLASALTFTVFTLAMRATSSSEAAILVSTETLITAVAAWAVLGERLTPLGLAGAAAILGAVVLVQLAAAARGRRGQAG